MSHLHIVIVPEEYDAFKRLTPNYKCFSGTYQDWIECSAKENKNRVAQGRAIH